MGYIIPLAVPSVLEATSATSAITDSMPSEATSTSTAEVTWGKLGGWTGRRVSR